MEQEKEEGTVEIVEVELYDKDGNPTERVVEEPAEVEAVASPEDDGFEVPEKFKGKSMEDVIRAYENAEQELGRKSNEVGELRKLTDQILQNQQAPAIPQDFNSNDTSVAFEDIVEDPEAAISKALSKNPTLQRLEENIAADAQAKARASLLQAHPDADDVVASAPFQSWLQERASRVRQFQAVAQSNDADGASDLLDLYKQTRMTTNAEATAERDAKAAAGVRKATVETGGGQTSTKKIYRRADLIQMKIQDPARYAKMQDEIMSAYAEGRVK